ncbi:MAG: RNA 2',3'-cyclic phosphodiesterase [Balneolaceae bacterium]
MRLFTAIPITEDIKERLSEVYKPLSGFKWVSSENLHLTLKFIGNTRRPEANELVEALESVEFDPFDITIRSLGSFPPKKHPSVLWAGVEAPPPLFELQEQIDEITRQYGAKPDRFDYRPHVTLARIHSTPMKEVAKLTEEFKDLEAGGMKVSQFVLYESKLQPGGAVHSAKRIYEARTGMEK